MPRARPLTTSAIPEDLSNPYYIEAHRKALMNTMYGQGGIMRVDVIGGAVQFTLNTTGQTFSSAAEAFAEASASGVTTFSRLTGNLGTSSGNLRGSGGLAERLLDIQRSLSVDQNLRSRLGISDPSKLYFEIGSFKIPTGQPESANQMLKRLEKGIVIADDGAFNLLQVFDPTRGAESALSVEEISRLLLATSKGTGGIITTDALIKAISDPENAAKNLAGLYQKVGKRIKGAISLRDVSIAGDDLSELISSLGTGQTSLNEKVVRIFNPFEDLSLVAETLLRRKEATGFFGDLSDKTLQEAFSIESLRSQRRFQFASEEELIKLSSELKDFYTGNSSVEAMVARLDRLGISSIEAFKSSDAIKGAIESAYDGTSVINSKSINYFKKSIQKELEDLNAKLVSGEIGEEGLARARELQSQLNNLRSGNLEAITGRVFLSTKGDDGSPAARMIKAVFDSAGLRGSLSDYAILTTDVALKKETALMGTTESINLVLQGEPSKLVYQDPLMPAFHYGVYDESFETAQRSRTARIMANYRTALETGKIDSALKARIFKDAEMDIESIPTALRDQASRNRLFAQRLRQAIESGADIRSMPNLMNYLANYTQSQLYRLKDGMYQPALEDAFRYAIDTEESFYAGRASGSARLGAGFEEITLSDKKTVKALQFEIRGHKMLFGGDAAAVFKQSLGGFDLDDHGIVMPRIFQDVSGNERLGVFMFRQPTGPSEFIFGRASLTNTDTIRSFLGDNDFFANTIDDFMRNTITSDSDKEIYSLLKNIMNGENSSVLQRNIDSIANRTPDAIERAIIEVMKGAKRYGYQPQTIDAASLLQNVQPGRYASPLAVDLDTINRLKAAGLSASEEKFLVEQYRDGIIRRAFVEEGAFKVDDTFAQSVRSAVGESMYNTRFASVEKDTNKFLYELSKIVSEGGELGETLQTIFDKDYVNKARKAVAESDSIGIYINRLTLASSSSQQMKEILKQAESKGLSASLIDEINKKMILAVSPSDVVDLIVNLNGTNDIGLERSAQVLEAFYSGATDREAATKAIARVLGITKEAQNSSLVDSLGLQMIETKGELIGNLRAVSRIYAQEADLIAGIDEEIIRQRLKGRDLTTFIESMQRGYLETIGKLDKLDPVTGQFIEGTDQALINDYNAMGLILRGDAQEQQDNLIKFLGLGAENKYAPLSRAARMGREAFEIEQAERYRLFSRSSTSLASEINMSADAIQISQNILQEYSSMIENNESLLNLLDDSSDEASEFLKYQKSLASAEINNKIYSMIYQAAEVNENVLVRDIVDNMEFMINSQSPKLRSLINGQIFGEQQNALINLFAGAQQSRRLRDAQRQGRNMDLVNSYNVMVDEVRSDSATRREVIEIMRQNIDRFNRNSTTGRLTEDLLAQASMVYQLGDERDFSLLGLSQENERMVRNRIADAQALRFFDENQGLEEILNFGRGADPSRLAPTGLLSSEDIDRITIFGDGPPDGPPPTRNYRQFMDSWRDGQMGEAFKNPIVKKGAYAAAALIGASLIYSATKDRTQEDISGPPLLPGGSSYEAMASRQPQIPNVSMFSGYNEGTSLQVNIEGSQEQIDSFTSVAGAGASSTMYKGLPQLGRDPYSFLAGSF